MERRLLRVNFLLDLDKLSETYETMKSDNIEYMRSKTIDLKGEIEYRMLSEECERKIDESAKEISKSIEQENRYKEQYEEILGRYCDAMRKLHFNCKWSTRDIAEFLNEDEPKIEMIIFDGSDI